MKSPFPHTQMPALAYLYDHVRELPAWFHRLTARQLQEIADLMVQWNIVSDDKTMLTMEQIEKREVLRVLELCDGNIVKAANVLKIGKTTIYRKLVQWGYSVHNRILVENASALARDRILVENASALAREGERQAKHSQSR